MWTAKKNENKEYTYKEYKSKKAKTGKDWQNESTLLEVRRTLNAGIYAFISIINQNECPSLVVGPTSIA